MYWLKVATDCDTPYLVKDACTLAKSESLQWANFIKNTLNNAGFPQVWIQPSSADPNQFIYELEHCLTDHYVQSWQGEGHFWEILNIHANQRVFRERRVPNTTSITK